MGIAVISFSLMAATITYSETQTVSTDLSLTEDTEISVADGITVTYEGQITAAAGVTVSKTGAGTLSLKAANNSFGANLIVGAGFLEAQAAGCLGEQTITLKGGQVRFNAEGATFPNPIVLATKAAGPGPRGEASDGDQGLHLFFDKSATLTGDIESENFTLRIGCNRMGKSVFYADWPVATFQGAVNMGTGNVNFHENGAYGIFKFHGKVTCKQFRSSDAYSSTGAIYFYQENAISQYWQNAGYLYLEHPDALKGAEYYNAIYWSGRGEMHVNTSEINLSHFRSPTSFDYAQYYPPTNGDGKGMSISGENPYTVRITGAQNGTYTSLIRLLGPGSLIQGEEGVTEDSFVQTFDYAASQMTGALIVSNGTMKVTRTAGFPKATYLEIAEGATLDFQSTARQMLAGLKRIKLDGTLVIDESSGSTFREDGELELELGVNSSLSYGQELALKSLKVNGEAKPYGVYTASELPQLKDGTQLYFAPPPATAVWTGASALTSTAMTEAGNWQGGVVPDLHLGTATVVISEEATNYVAKMTYQDGTVLNSISNDIPFMTNTAETAALHIPFRLEPATPNARLYLRGGIQSYYRQFTSNASGYLHRGQLVLSGRILLPEGIEGGAASGDNPYAIRIRNSNFINTSRPAGEIIENSLLDTTSLRAVPLVLTNATVDLPMYFVQAGTQNTVLIAAPGSTNTVKGNIYSSSYQANAAAGENAVLELRGGVESNPCFRFLGPGEIRIVDKPFTINQGSYTRKNVKLVLDAENCNPGGNSGTREGFYHTSGKLEFKRSWCFKTEDMQFSICNEHNSLIGTEVIEVEFNATTQRVGRVYFCNTANGSVLKGKYPAMLEMTGRAREVDASKLYAPTNNIQVTGGLGFHVCGQGAYLPLGKQTYQSYGDLEASAGTLELLPDASWPNGTNFTARGTGIIKFNSGAQINRNFALLHLGADDGKVSIPEGERLVFAAADLGGAPVPVGTYTATSGGVISSRIEGGGTVRIGVKGTCLTFR